MLPPPIPVRRQDGSDTIRREVDRVHFSLWDPDPQAPVCPYTLMIVA